MANAVQPLLLECNAGIEDGLAVSIGVLPSRVLRGGAVRQNTRPAVLGDTIFQVVERLARDPFFLAELRDGFAIADRIEIRDLPT